MARTMVKSPAAWALVVGALVSPAAAMEPLQGLRSLALGGSMRGMATGAEGLLLNPSGIAMAPQYAVTAFYSFRLQRLGHGLHISVADSVTQRRLAMGLYYNYVNESPQASFRVTETGGAGRSLYVQDARFSRQGHQLGLVTGIPLGERFALGITTKYNYFSLTAPVPREQIPQDFVNDALNKAEGAYDFGSLGNALTFDVGMTLRLWRGLSLGVAGQNLWPHGPEVPTLLGMGLTYGASERFSLAADATLNFTGNQQCNNEACTEQGDRTTVRVGGGAEYLIGGRVPLRAGYLYDSNLGSHHVSGGLGYFDPRIAIDVSVQQRVAGGMETILVGGFRFLRD